MNPEKPLNLQKKKKNHGVKLLGNREVLRNTALYVL